MCLRVVLGEYLLMISLCIVPCHIFLTVRVLGSSEVLTERCVSLLKLLLEEAVAALCFPPTMQSHVETTKHVFIILIYLGLAQEIGHVYLPQHVPMCFLPLAQQ